MKEKRNVKKCIQYILIVLAFILFGIILGTLSGEYVYYISRTLLLGVIVSFALLKLSTKNNSNSKPKDSK